MQQCAYVGASLLPEDQPLVTSVPIGPYGVRKQPKKRLSSLIWANTMSTWRMTKNNAPIVSEGSNNYLDHSYKPIRNYWETKNRSFNWNALHDTKSGNKGKKTKFGSTDSRTINFLTQLYS